MKLLKNPRILILIITLFLALVAINPHPWNEGAAIRIVAKGSAAELAGIESPTPRTPPVARERIIAVNNQPVTNAASYYELVSGITALGENVTFTIRTNKGFSTLTTRPAYETITLNETELVSVTEQLFNETLNETVNVTRQELRNKTFRRKVGVEDVGITVYDAPKTNIRKGLDLSGGTRVVLKPEERVSEEDLDLIVANIKERLNVFGLSDVIVRTATDLSGESFIIVEVAGATKEEVRSLLSQQGKFEAKIGNVTVFRGGDKDITYVCRSADCSGIDPQAGCRRVSSGEWLCRFRYTISLSPAAAERQAAVTRELDVITTKEGSYLSETLDLFLDDEFVDSLQIAADLKGRALTDIMISGSGVGRTQAEATQDALDNMKTLQTVMITGSLPVKLGIVRVDAISPVLGEEFVRNALLVGLFALLAVVLIVFARYREVKIALPMILTMASEAVIILGFASLVGWNLDLAAIAAIIIAIGTGVDDQIVIADETLRGARGEFHALSWKERVKRAFFIIMAAYVTTVAAMVPLWFAGAGMLRGFAITTIIGVSVGVFVTRPAFAAMVEHFVKKEE